MAHVRYESKLSPEQIRARISVHARPAAFFGWRMSDSALFYKFYNSRRFFLVKTSPGAALRPSAAQPVFLGRLTEKDGGTVIEGRFGWEPGPTILFCLLLALAFACIRPGVSMLLFSGLLLLLGAFFARALLSSLFTEEERAVLELIEKHLLS